MTHPKNLYTKAIHIKNTWAKRCDVTLFVPGENYKDPNFPIIELNSAAGRSHLSNKTWGAFDHIYKHYVNKADWFLKADDDTYVIVENLRYFLSNKDTNKPLIFGHHFDYNGNAKMAYVSGGAGYVISKAALALFGQNRQSVKTCEEGHELLGKSEDWQFSACLKDLGVKLGNSRDKLGNSRFHCLTPRDYLLHKFPQWVLKFDQLSAIKVR